MSAAEKIDRFDTPAKLMPAHHVVNPQDPERWWKYEVKDDSPLGLAYNRGKLASGRRDYTAEDRYGAGHIYRGIYESVNGSSHTVSNVHRVSGAATEARASERLCIARDLHKRLRRELSRDNFAIVDAFCGAGSNASDAVKARLSGFDKATYLAICSALDDLIDGVMALGLHKVGKGT